MNVKYKKITELIKKSDIIYLYRHVKPDPDALGSVFGLKEIIKDNFKNKRIIICGDSYPHLNNIFPNPNINQKVKGNQTLSIICDTANTARIDGEGWNETKNIIKIDHHPNGDLYGTLNVVEETNIAAAQVVAQWAFAEKLKISKKAATYLFTGIVTDSGRFLFPQTSHKTLDISSKLMLCGVNTTKLYNKLYYSSDLKHAKFKAYLISNAKISKKVASIYISEEIAKKFNMTIEDISLHANFFSGYKDVDIWSLARFDEKGIKISARSKEKYAINKIAQKFNGGGHKNACAAIVKSKAKYKSFIKELKTLIK